LFNQKIIVMKKKRVIILPFDGYICAAELLKAVEKIVANKDIADFLAYIKINDGVHNIDMGGPEIIKSIKAILAKHNVPAGIFLDLKCKDVSLTLENVLRKYAADSIAPEILTVSSQVSAETLVKLRALLPKTKLAMVSMLTDIKAEECSARFGQAPEVKIYNDLMNIRPFYWQGLGFEKGKDSGPEPFDLIVCSPVEVEFLKKNLPKSYGFIVPGIRDEWMKKKNEHQKRITGVRQAMISGATYVVMGAQMLKGNPELGISPEESRQLTAEELEKVPEDFTDLLEVNPLLVLRNCEGYYESPRKGTGGDYTGPVVAYAKKYDDGAGEQKNMVGFVYLNFAKAEQYPAVRKYFADRIAEKFRMFNLEADLALGAPMGGLFLAADLGHALNCRTAFAEKVVKVAADKGKNVREESELIIDRHDIRPGDKVVLVEDVTNNFSTTEKMVELIRNQGGVLVAILSAFNRSGKDKWNFLPVISACDIRFDQYRQDAVAVADIIKAGNIILKPKLQWDKLAQAMKEGEKGYCEE